MHIAAEGKRWMNRQILFAAFDYPFNQLGVRRITGLVPGKNMQARGFDEHIGFRLEGVMRNALKDDDILVYGMLREECRWLDLEKKLKRD
jgi:RimJ/RimL family protein N-acetyltransferase